MNIKMYNEEFRRRENPSCRKFRPVAKSALQQNLVENDSAMLCVDNFFLLDHGKPFFSFRYNIYIIGQFIQPNPVSLIGAI